MRKTRLGAVASAAVLAAATVLGGAGAANASVSTDSLENLGDLENLIPGDLFPGDDLGFDVVLALDPVEGAEDGDLDVTGTVAHELEETTLDCTVTVADAADVQEAQQQNAAGEEFELDGTATPAVAVEAGEHADWAVTVEDAPEDFTAAAAVQCENTDNAEDTHVAFAYQATEADLLGSLEILGIDTGSLDLLEGLDLELIGGILG